MTHFFMLSHLPSPSSTVRGDSGVWAPTLYTFAGPFQGLRVSTRGTQPSQQACEADEFIPEADLSHVAAAVTPTAAHGTRPSIFPPLLHSSRDQASFPARLPGCSGRSASF